MLDNQSIPGYWPLACTLLRQLNFNAAQTHHTEEGEGDSRISTFPHSRGGGTADGHKSISK